MSLELLFLLAKIIAQNSAYLGCLSLVAWRGERQRGQDAFHVVVVYALGVWLLSMLVGELGLGQLLAAGAVGLLAFSLDSLWPSAHRQEWRNQSLVQLIVLASISLIGFDWLTSHTPVSLPVDGVRLRNFSMICAVVAWALALTANKTRAGMMLRLGTRNRWAIEYWSRPLPASSPALIIVGALCWVPIITLPVVTTGLLSSTILKDVAIAILIARIAASRGPIVVLAASVTLSALRAIVGFAFLNNAGPPLVEAMVFISLLLWLRYRTSRTSWEEVSGR
jgi:hypothetical protein